MANAEIRSTKVKDRQIENGPLLFEREVVQRVTIVACPECDEALYTVVGTTTDEEASKAYREHRTKPVEWGRCRKRVAATS